MPIVRNLGLVLGIILTFSAFSANAQIAVEQGSATIAINKTKPSSAERILAEKDAAINAYKRYLAKLPTTKQKMIRACDLRAIEDRLDDYLLGQFVLTENVDKDARRMTSVVKVEINTASLLLDIDEVCHGPDPTPRFNAEVAAIMIGRKITSQTLYDDSIEKTIAVNQQADMLNSTNQMGFEGENISNSSIQTTTSQTNLNVNEANLTAKLKSGGHYIQRAAKKTYSTASQSVLEAQMYSELNNIGMNVVESTYIPGINLRQIRLDYGDSDELSQATEISIANAVKDDGIPYLLIGTLDVGLSEIDPISGNYITNVLVTAKVLNLQNRRPVLALVAKPEPYVGMGRNEEMATISAVTKAAEHVGQDILDRLAVRQVQ